MAVLNGAFLAAAATAQAPAAPANPPAKKKEPQNPMVIDESSPVRLSEITATAKREGYKVDELSSPKLTESILDTPRSISIVPEAVMRDQNATNLREILRNVPGITIQAGEGGETPGDNFIIRGFSARSDMFIDGVRDAGGFFRDPFNVEQVEVAKGPGSSIAGRGSTGGTINIVTKKPVSERFYRGSLSLGTSNFARGTIDINQPFHLGSSASTSTVGFGKDAKQVVEIDPPNAAFRLNAVWHENDVAGRDFTDFKRWGIAPSFTIGLNSPSQLTLSYSHLDQDNTPDFGLPWVTATNNSLASYRNQPAPVSFENHYGIGDRDFERVRTDEALLIFSHKFSDELDLRYTVHYGRASRDSITSAPRFFSNDSALINREFQSRDQVDSVFTNEIDLTGRFETFGVKHTVVAGLEYTRENSKNYLRSGPAAPFADLYDPDYQDPFPGVVRRTGAVNEADTETVGAYIFDTMKIGEKWQVSGGARFDYFDVDYTMRDAAGAVTPFAHLDKMVSWNAALSYKPVEDGTIYVAYGNSFNPSAQGLTLNASTAALDPEKTRTLELGTKWDLFSRQLSVSAAVFHTLKENARTPGLNAGDPPTVLRGEQEVNGFEVSVTGNITPSWKVIGGYTYLDTQIKKSNNPLEVGNELPGAARNTFSIWTTYAITPDFQVGAGANYVGERFANPINTRKAGDYITFDAMAAYRVSENLTLQVNVLNITDEEYISGLHVAGSFGHFIPGPGRTAMITANLAF